MAGKMPAATVLGLLAAVMLAGGAHAATPSRWDITEHGAVGDGSTLNTKAIQTTIDRCAARGGGMVVVPKGEFLTGAIFFKPHVNLLVEKDGVLKGTTNLDDYPLVHTRWEGVERDWTSALINCFSMTNFVLRGEGMIDGSGDRWPQPPRRATPRRTSSLVSFAATSTRSSSSSNVRSAAASGPSTADGCSPAVSHQPSLDARGSLETVPGKAEGPSDVSRKGWASLRRRVGIAAGSLGLLAVLVALYVGLHGHATRPVVHGSHHALTAESPRASHGAVSGHS